MMLRLSCLGDEEDYDVRKKSDREEEKKGHENENDLKEREVCLGPFVCIFVHGWFIFNLFCLIVNRLDESCFAILLTHIFQ